MPSASRPSPLWDGAWNWSRLPERALLTSAPRLSRRGMARRVDPVKTRLRHDCSDADRATAFPMSDGGLRRVTLAVHYGLGYRVCCCRRTSGMARSAALVTPGAPRKWDGAWRGSRHLLASRSHGCLSCRSRRGTARRVTRIPERVPVGPVAECAAAVPGVGRHTVLLTSNGRTMRVRLRRSRSVAPVTMAVPTGLVAQRAAAVPVVGPCAA